MLNKYIVFLRGRPLGQFICIAAYPYFVSLPAEVGPVIGKTRNDMRTKLKQVSYVRHNMV